ncbi:hypothetical protein AB0L40_17250 [Patulibacter sp. NPDC049589]|uniref:hypothetical protein n=1 Tax=Patulibacter sp. NPDC049589 TaxID=3154731 RepID=UPI0034462255
MKRRLFDRIPTTGGAVLLAVVTLFVALPLAQVVVRVGDLEGAGALLLELAIIVGVTGGAWSAFPERWSTPWNGFYSGNEVEPWVDPADRDDGRRTPGDPDPYEERFPRSPPRSGDGDPGGEGPPPPA